MTTGFYCKEITSRVVQRTFYVGDEVSRGDALSIYHVTQN